MALTPRVLLVDDNAALVDNLRETLEDEKYAVTTAGTAAEGGAWARRRARAAAARPQ